MKTLVLIMLALVASSCAERACIRQSDCAPEEFCSAALLCESNMLLDLMIDDGSADGGAASTDLIATSACYTAVHCEVWSPFLDRPLCLEALDADHQQATEAVFQCVIGACAGPGECEHHQFDTELVDENLCWQCAERKLGTACVLDKCL